MFPRIAVLPTFYVFVGFPLLSLADNEHHIAIQNHSFESFTESLQPSIWQVNPNGYSVSTDTQMSRSGQASLRISATANRSKVQGASVVQFLRPDPHRAQHLTLSAYAKTTDVADGQVSLWAMVRKQDETIFFDNMRGRGIVGTTSWRNISLDIPVLQGGDAVVYGLLHSGDGTAWFDDIAMSVDYVDSEGASGSEGTDHSRVDGESSDGSRRKSDVALLNRVRRLVSDSVASRVATDAKILAVGEFSHGSYEMNLLYLELLKELHENFGYSILAIETGFVKCSSFLTSMPSGIHAADVLRLCASPQKQTTNFLELMRYVISTWNTRSPVRLVGIDSAVIGAETSSILEPVLKTLESKDPSLVDKIRTYNLHKSDFPAREFEMAPLDAHEQEHVIALLTDAVVLFRNMCADSPTQRCGPAAEISLQRLRNLWSYTKQSTLGIVTTEAKLLRDKTMAENVIFVSDNLYPHQKILLFSHNAHVRKANDEVYEVSGSPLLPTMGSWLAEHFQSQYRVLGAYALQGEAREPVIGVIKMLPTPTSTDLTRNGFLYNHMRFLDADNHQSLHHKGWARGHVTFLESGSSQVTFEPWRNYDGLFILGYSSRSELIH